MEGRDEREREREREVREREREEREMRERERFHSTTMAEACRVVTCKCYVETYTEEKKTKG